MRASLDLLKIEKGITSLGLLLALLLTVSGCAGIEPTPPPTMAALKPTETLSPPTVAPAAIPITAPTDTPIPPPPTAIRTEASPTIAAQATPTPAQYAQEIATSRAEQAKPTSTPIPIPFRLTAETKVPLAIKDFRLMGLDGDTAVGVATVNGEHQVMLVDLTTGEMRQISSAVGTTAKYAAHVSERWVIWEEYTYVPPEKGAGEDRVMAYDREREREFQLREINAYGGEIDLSGDIVVWNGGSNQSTGVDIFAYDLVTQQKTLWLKLPDRQALPRIAGPWLIYVTVENAEVKLRAHHLATGEDFEIGPLFRPDDARWGTQHTITGHWVLWVNPQRELHVYDLDKRTDRAMFPGTTTGEAFLKTFGDNALIFRSNQRIGLYTLDSSQKHTMLDVPELAGVNSDLLVSGDRVVWSVQNDKGAYLQIMRLTQ